MAAAAGYRCQIVSLRLCWRMETTWPVRCDFTLKEPDVYRVCYKTWNNVCFKATFFGYRLCFAASPVALRRLYLFMCEP